MAMSLDSRPAMCSRSRPREHRLKHHRRPRRSRPLPSRRRSPSNHLHAHEQNPDCRQFPPVLCERRRLAFRSTTTINLDDFSGFAPSTNLNKPLPPPPMSGLSASLNLASIPLPPTDDSGTTPYSPFAATSTPAPAPSSSSSSQAFTDVLLRPEQLLPGSRSGAAVDDDDAADIEEQRLARQSLPRVTLPYERFRQACYHSHSRSSSLAPHLFGQCLGLSLLRVCACHRPVQPNYDDDRASQLSAKLLVRPRVWQRLRGVSLDRCCCLRACSLHHCIESVSHNGSGSLVVPLSHDPTRCLQ